ncbi:MAG: PadR family transcriptional regulator [Cyanobacteria bacterium P01_D01_bin.36]
MSSGTIYPILLRLEKNGFVESKWEVEDPSSLKRPRRRLYRITGAGSKAAQDALAEFNTLSLQPKVTYGGAAQC